MLAHCDFQLEIFDDETLAVRASDLIDFAMSQFVL